MTNNRFDPILDRVWIKVKDRKQGVLFTTICILAPKDATRICQDFGIKEFNYFNEDIQTLHQIKYLSDLLNKTPMKFSIDLYSMAISATTKIISGLSKNILSNENSPNNLIQVNPLTENSSDINLTDKIPDLLGFKVTNNLIIQFIIGIGLIFVGLYLLNGYLNPSNQKSSSRKPPVTNSSKSDAVLCLIVPTNRIDSEFRNILLPEDELRQETTKLLLDKSVYFITCAEENLDNYIGGLNLSQAQINYDDGGEIYIELLLPEGEDTIGQDVQRIISRNLPDIAIIKGVYQLNNLRNIERFHRA